MNSVSAPARTERITVVAERLSGPLDEGGRKFAYLLAKALERFCDVQMISIGGAESSAGLVRVPHSRTFVNPAIRDAVRESRPDIICYAPASSLTVFSLARGRMLKRAAPNARVALLAFQPREASRIGRALASKLRPDAVVVLDSATGESARRLGSDPIVLRPAVDLDLFCPVDAETRTALRRKLGLPEDEFIALHVGHAKRERGVAALAGVEPFGKAVLVVASSEGRDDGLIEELRSRGVAVVDEYVAAVHEYYQAADCFVFPVFQPDSAISAPLSVLEAMACNLPVLTSAYGALPAWFSGELGFRYIRSPEEIASALEDRSWAATVQTREMVSPFTWENTAREFLQILGVQL